MQACGCAALAALLEAPDARAQLQASGGGQLVAQTLCEHMSDAEADAAVRACMRSACTVHAPRPCVLAAGAAHALPYAVPLQVHTCGWRAMLALLVGTPDPDPDPNPASASAGEVASGQPAVAATRREGVGGGVEAPPELVALLWQSMALHARRAAVQAVCIELLAALLAEDCRRAVLRRADLQVLSDARAARHALQQVCLRRACATCTCACLAHAHDVARCVCTMYVCICARSACYFGGCMPRS